MKIFVIFASHFQSFKNFWQWYDFICTFSIFSWIMYFFLSMHQLNFSCNFFLSQKLFLFFFILPLCHQGFWLLCQDFFSLEILWNLCFLKFEKLSFLVCLSSQSFLQLLLFFTFPLNTRKQLYISFKFIKNMKPLASNGE